MTAQDIIARLFTGKGCNLARVAKAQGAAMRSKIEWADVMATMTDAQRKLVSDAR